jgi:hypothetical protein
MSAKQGRPPFTLRRRRIGDDLKRPLPSLTKLLKRKEFDSICKVLNDPKMNLGKWFEGEYSVLGENCLHEIMKHRPPAKLVELVLQRLVEYGIPEPELSVDIIGRTPLHHALGYVCDPTVVRVLVSGHAGKLSTRAHDIEGRLPLHVATRPHELWVGKNLKRRQITNVDPVEVQIIMRKTVELLVAVYPQSVLVQDDKKNCYAICTCSSIRSRLQAVRRTDLRRPPSCRRKGIDTFEQLETYS